jgi:hypothetical protein
MDVFWRPQNSEVSRTNLGSIPMASRTPRLSLRPLADGALLHADFMRAVRC